MHEAARALEAAIGASGETAGLLDELAGAMQPLLEGIAALADGAADAPQARGGVHKERLAAEIAELERLLSKNSLTAKRQFARLCSDLPAGESATSSAGRDRGSGWQGRHHQLSEPQPPVRRFTSDAGAG